MIKASEALAGTNAKKMDARNSKIFMRAIQRLEEDIKKAMAYGKRNISYNISYFDIRPFSSLEKDVYATEADRQAIKEFMEENGYHFYFHSVMSMSGRLNSCFTCEW